MTLKTETRPKGMETEPTTSRCDGFILHTLKTETRPKGMETDPTGRALGKQESRFENRDPPKGDGNSLYRQLRPARTPALKTETRPKGMET